MPDDWTPKELARPLPREVALLANQIAQEVVRPYTVATARAVRMQALQHLDAGMPQADLVRLLQREREAAARIAMSVDAHTPGIHALALAPARLVTKSAEKSGLPGRAPTPAKREMRSPHCC